MATTRYAWDQYKANKNAFSNPGSSANKVLNNATFHISTSPPQAEMLIEGTYANKPFYRGSGSSFTTSGITKSYSVSSYGKYLYTAGYGNSILCVVPDIYNSTLSDLEWSVGDSVYLGYKNSSGTITYKTYEPSVTKGDYVTLISTTKATSLPKGYDGSAYWYVYKGSDNIEPSSIYLSQSKIEPGQQLTINISAPGVKYGGVIYDVSYSVNGGSYQKLTDTQEKTINFTIPSNTETIKFRVYSTASTSYSEQVISGYVYSSVYSTNEAPSAPGSVTMPAEVYPETLFTVTWAASTDPDGNLHGYEIQRSYDGSSSWSSVTTTTSTSITTTVERGKKTVRYRVRAYDSKSEYSSWAYSNTATIRNLRAYVGINGKARKVDKMYIGVNGKARQVVKGYIGVNGKARKFL